MGFNENKYMDKRNILQKQNKEFSLKKVLNECGIKCLDITYR